MLAGIARCGRLEWAIRSPSRLEILLVEGQLSATDRRVTPQAVGWLGEVILGKLLSERLYPPARLRTQAHRQIGGGTQPYPDHGAD